MVPPVSGGTYWSTSRLVRGLPATRQYIYNLTTFHCFLQGTFVEGIKEEVVLSPAHALSLIAAGEGEL
ncbi:hypothetical protein GW17_00015701 [Ensete ventricosum]|nr:hypothetical protein GW17_00015701 [Ensete ventricosum]